MRAINLIDLEAGRVSFGTAGVSTKFALRGELISVG
jgi:hypothetical protein